LAAAVSETVPSALAVLLNCSQVPAVDLFAMRAEAPALSAHTYRLLARDRRLIISANAVKAMQARTRTAADSFVNFRIFSFLSVLGVLLRPCRSERILQEDYRMGLEDRGKKQEEKTAISR
jgi:hypothetical protein